MPEQQYLCYSSEAPITLGRWVAIIFLGNTTASTAPYLCNESKTIICLILQVFVRLTTFAKTKPCALGFTV